MQDDLPKSSEIIIRGLIRFPDQLTGKFARPHKDRDEDALICSFECTYCRDCVENKLQSRCPNCGGNL